MHASLVYINDRVDRMLRHPLSEGVDHNMQSEMIRFLRSFNNQVTGLDRIAITPIRDLYDHFEYRDLSAHPAIVLLPYQVQ